MATISRSSGMSQPSQPSRVTLPRAMPQWTSQADCAAMGSASTASVLATELVNASGSVDKFLFPGIKRMAIGTDFDMEIVLLDGRACREACAATAGDVDVVISGMNTVFHEWSLKPFVRQSVLWRPTQTGRSSRIAVDYSTMTMRGIETGWGIQ